MSASQCHLERNADLNETLAREGSAFLELAMSVCASATFPILYFASALQAYAVDRIVAFLAGQYTKAKERHWTEIGKFSCSRASKPLDSHFSGLSYPKKEKVNKTKLSSGKSTKPMPLPVEHAVPLLHCMHMSDFHGFPIYQTQKTRNTHASLFIQWQIHYKKPKSMEQ